MRNYQKKKGNPYLLPHNLYMRTLYIIKDYDRMRDEYQNILHGSPPPNIITGKDIHGNEVGEFGGRGSGTSNPAQDKALNLAMVSDELHAVEQAIRMIPEEYRQGVFQNIRYGTPYPEVAHYNTWRNWKRKFIWGVAQRLHFI